MTINDLIRELQRYPGHLPVAVLSWSKPYVPECEVWSHAREALEVRHEGRYVAIIAPETGLRHSDPKITRLHKLQREGPSQP